MGSNPTGSTILADDRAPSVRFIIFDCFIPNRSGLEALTIPRVALVHQAQNGRLSSMVA